MTREPLLFEDLPLMDRPQRPAVKRHKRPRIKRKKKRDPTMFPLPGRGARKREPMRLYRVILFLRALRYYVRRRGARYHLVGGSVVSTREMRLIAKSKGFA